MSHRLPPLNWLRAFEAAARRASFAAAARELHMTQPAVSYQIRALEKSLGAALFTRHARRVELTAMGRAYLPSVRHAFSQLAASTAGLFGLGGDRQVTVRCAATFAALWLAPRLPRFHAAHPDIAVRLATSTWAEGGRAADGGDGDPADVEIRYGDGTWRAYEVVAIQRERSVAVCTPALRDSLGDTLGAPPSAAACAESTLIHIMGYETFWQHWFQAAGIEAAPGWHGLSVDNSVVALEIAAAGHGLALVFETFARPYLDAGRLVMPLPHAFESEMAHYLVLPEREAPLPPEALIFRDWLLNEARRAD